MERKGDLWKNRARDLLLLFLLPSRSLPPRFPPFLSTFYRKPVSEHLNTEEDSVFLRMLQAVAVPVLGNVCHVFMNGFNRVTSAFFLSVEVLPVSCRRGIYQKGMDMALAKLNTGGWVHIFPEGSRSLGGGKSMGSSKRGVGRSLLCCWFPSIPALCNHCVLTPRQVGPGCRQCPHGGSIRVPSTSRIIFT